MKVRGGGVNRPVRLRLRTGLLRLPARVARSLRESARRPRNIVFFLLALGLCFTVGPILRYCRDHRYFAVRSVEVQGLRRLDAARVRMWLGMVEGRSIWQASPRGLAATLESHPAIARATVRRVLPDRLAIVVKEREPRALLRYGGRSYLVDRAGEVIGDAPLLGGDLPIITLPSPDEFSTPVEPVVFASEEVQGPGAGDPWMPSTAELRQAVQVARMLESGAAGVEVSEITLRPADRPVAHPELVAFSSDGRFTIQFGWGDWRDKLDALRQVVGRASFGPPPPAPEAKTVKKAGKSGGRRSEKGKAAGQAAESAEAVPADRVPGTIDVRDPETVVVRWARPAASVRETTRAPLRRAG